MIIYVNGDSHSAGAETYSTDKDGFVSFKQDDSAYWKTIGTPEGKQAHPNCIKASYGQKIADKLKALLVCDAVPGSSNARINRVTREFFNIRKNTDLVIIGWSTWEREEWMHNNVYYQISAAGIDHDWPDELKTRYKEWVVNLDMPTSIKQAHDDIFDLHIYFQARNQPHIFFNCFEEIKHTTRVNWDGCYLEPYDKDYTYYNWCRSRGFATVSPDSYHFGADAHEAWAEFLYAQIVQNCLTKKS